MIDRSLRIYLATALAIAIAWPALAQDAPRIRKLRIGIPTWSHTFLPLIAAKKQGFYARQGLDVELIIVQATIAPQALITGEIDFDTNTPRDLTLALRGGPLRLVMALNKAPIHALIVKPDIQTANDLRGKTLGSDFPRGFIERLLIRGMQKYGLVPNRDVTLLSLGGGGSDIRVTSLLAGKVDGTLISPPHSTTAIYKHGFRTFFYVREFSGLFSGSLAATTEKINRDPEGIVRLLKGTIEGIRFLRSSKSEFLRLLAQEARVTDSQMAEQIYKDFLDVVPETGIAPDSATQETINFAKEDLGITKEIPISELVNWSFAQRALKELQQAK